MPYVSIWRFSLRLDIISRIENILANVRKVAVFEAIMSITKVLIKLMEDPRPFSTARPKANFLWALISLSLILWMIFLNASSHP
jgi:hypothetical protein